MGSVQNCSLLRLGLDEGASVYQAGSEAAVDVCHKSTNAGVDALPPQERKECDHSDHRDLGRQSHGLLCRAGKAGVCFPPPFARRNSPERR